MIKNFFIILIIFVFTTSCKDDTDTTKKIKNSVDEAVEVSIEKIYKGNFLYKAIVNSKLGLNLRDVNGKKITGIPYGEEVLITKFLKFETIRAKNNIKVHGKWVEIVYQTETEYLKGKVFDGYLDYKLNVKESYTYEDTIVVKNEREFFKSLRSNRTIIVNAKEINLDKGEAFLADSEYEDEFYGVSYEEGYDEDYKGTLILSDFNNLEIKGKELVHFITKKSDDNVINFENCNNIYIDNINFYHKEAPSCEGDVLGFYKCDNFYFQNSHFDGSGLTAISANESDNLNFLNCDFYNNHNSVIYSDNVGNISLNRCDIYDNEFSYIIYNSFDSDDENKINISDCFIDGNELSSFFGTRNQGGICTIENSLITNNDFSDDMINQGSMSKINIKHTAFINNTSTSNKYLIERDGSTDAEMILEHVSFKDNIDFYDFNRKGSVFEKKENVIIADVYNQKSDTLLTKFNEFTSNGLDYIKRSDEDFKYEDATNELSINGHLLQGLHKLNFSAYNDFYSFKYNDESSSKDSYIGLGNILKGKLEGEWEIKNHSYTDIVEYSNGEILKTKREIIINRKTKETRVIEKGAYVNNKREGVFTYSYADGTPRKKLTFKEGVLDYPQEYYFPSGQLRFVRTKSKSIHHHPNGTIIAEVVYNNQGKLVVDESKFYDIDGNLKETKAVPENKMTYYINGGASIKFDGVEEHTDKVFTRESFDIIEFTHYNNSIARYKVGYSDLIHKSLDLKVGVSEYAEFYVDAVEHKQILYIFGKEHDIVYKAIIENKEYLDLDIYDRQYNLKKVFKQYFYNDKKYMLHGDVKYYSKGYMHDARIYEKGKMIRGKAF